jgi:hypothetical protein
MSSASLSSFDQHLDDPLFLRQHLRQGQPNGISKDEDERLLDEIELLLSASQPKTRRDVEIWLLKPKHVMIGSLTGDTFTMVSRRANVRVRNVVTSSMPPSAALGLLSPARTTD